LLNINTTNLQFAKKTLQTYKHSATKGKENKFSLRRVLKVEEGYDISNRLNTCPYPLRWRRVPSEFRAPRSPWNCGDTNKRMRKTIP
jgi:hypothetical protein